MNKLPRAPLQEVIFEVKWELQLDDITKAFRDPEFQFAQGKFQNAVAAKFPVYKNKVPEDIPTQFLGHKTVHQFWKKENTWPVLQLGPGILTVNDTETNYEWEKTYLPLIKETLGLLNDSYHTSLNFISYSLKYIDVVHRKDYPLDGWEGFINQNFNFQFSNSFKVPGELNGFRFDQSFTTPDAGSLEIKLSNGKNQKKEDIFVWQTAVSENKTTDQEGLLKWLENAHLHTSNTFKEICKEEFYGSFIQSK